MAKIVLTDAKMDMLQNVWPEINALGKVYVAESDDEKTLIQKVSDAELLIICYAQITSRIIEAGKNLKAILKWGVWVDSIDIKAATGRRIPVCHCPNYGSGTIADHAFALMKPTAVIINTARGALIQEEPLLNALRRKKIAGAAIDVFDSEPIDASHPFYEMKNVLVTPHFAYYTIEADARLDRECYYSAKRILNNEKLVNVKNGDALAALGEPVRWFPYGELPYTLD